MSLHQFYRAISTSGLGITAQRHLATLAKQGALASVTSVPRKHKPTRSNVATPSKQAYFTSQIDLSESKLEMNPEFKSTSVASNANSGLEYASNQLASSLSKQLSTLADTLLPEFLKKPMNAFRRSLTPKGAFAQTQECMNISWYIATQNAGIEMAEARNYIRSDIASREAQAKIKTTFTSIASSRYRTPAFPSSTPYAYYAGVVSRAAEMAALSRGFGTVAAAASALGAEDKSPATSQPSSQPPSDQSSSASSSGSSSSPSSASNSTPSTSSKFTPHHSVCPDVLVDPVAILKLAGLPNPLEVPRGQLPLEYFEMDPAKDSDRTDLLWPAHSAPPASWIPPGIEETFEEGMKRLKDDRMGQAVFALKFVSLKVFRMLKNIITGLVSMIIRYSRDPSLIRPAWENVKSVVKHEAKHYWHGSKLLVADVRTASRLALIRAQGGALSRRERRQLIRTTGDIFRLIPFAVIVVIPFLEFALPLILKLFPNFLPSTFQDKHQEAAKIKTELKARLELADFLQDTMETLARQKLAEAKALKAAAKSASASTAAALAASATPNSAGVPSDVAVATPPTPGMIPEGVAAGAASAEKMMEIIKMVRSGQRVDNEQLLAVAALFQDDITLDNLSRAHLIAMCKYMKLSPYGSDTALRERLRDKVEEIREDDELIEKEGIHTLSLEELREACRDRGMRVNGLTKHGLIRNITAWIDLSVHKRVPASLLLLSRALSISERPLDETLMTALSSIDEATVDEVFSDAGLDSTDPETRLESIRRQNDIIAEEMEARRAVFERQRQAKLKEAEAAVAASSAAAPQATAAPQVTAAAAAASSATTPTTTPSTVIPTTTVTPPTTSTPPIKLTTVSASAPATDGTATAAKDSAAQPAGQAQPAGTTTVVSAPAPAPTPAAKPAAKPAAPTSPATAPDDLTRLSDALTDLTSPSAVSSEREKLKKLRAEQEEIEGIVRSPPETPTTAATAASQTPTPTAAASSASAPGVTPATSAQPTTTTTTASSAAPSTPAPSADKPPSASAIAKTAADIRARAAQERMLAEKKAQEAMRAKIELEAALAKLPNKDTAMDIVLSTMSQVTPGGTFNPSQLPSLFWPQQQRPALPLWQAGLIDDKGTLRQPETEGQVRVLNRFALRVARQMTRYLDRYERDRRLAAENADVARRNKHMTTLSKQVNSMLNQLESRIEDADRTIGEQLYLLDKDKDGRISTRELQIVLKEHLKAASTEEEAAALVSKIKKLSASKGWYMSVDDIKRIAQEFSELTEEERLTYLEQQEQAARNASEAQAKLHKYITATAEARHAAAAAREATMAAQRATPASSSSSMTSSSSQGTLQR